MSFRAGFVGILGLPNAGKSTLLNALVGEKVSIVTAKPQTTRRRMVGLIHGQDHQILLVDAPGLVRAERGLNSFLRAEALDVAAQSDALMVLLNIDAADREMLVELLDLVRRTGKPWVAVITKTDLPQTHRVKILEDMIGDDEIPRVVGSLLKPNKQMAAELIGHLRLMLPETPAPLYGSELYTLANEREICQEIVREKCFCLLHQEIPFGLAVRCLGFDEDGPLVRIYSEIIVAKDNHRPIVVGREGQLLKEIGTQARKDIEKFLGRRVYLDLRVRSERNWYRNKTTMKELGYAVITA